MHSGKSDDICTVFNTLLTMTLHNFNEVDGDSASTWPYEWACPVICISYRVGHP